MNKTRPKLLLFSHVSNTGSITGAEKLLLLFCRRMASYFDCVLTAPTEGKLTAYARSQGTPVYIQSFPLLFGMYHPGGNIIQEAEGLRRHPAFVQIAKLIARIRPDIVLTNTVVNVLPAMAAKVLGIPVIWKITEVIHENEHVAGVLDTIGRYSDWVITISKAASSAFQGKLPVPVTILPPSADNKALQPVEAHVRKSKRERLRLKGNHCCIGYISSFIQPEKGLKEFINMALSLCSQNRQYRFLVVGRAADQAYFDDCIQRVKHSGYGARFRFIPFVRSVQTIYSAMDIVVIPSMVPEGFGMTALEAMLCGKPVVAFASGGLEEMMECTGNAQLAVTTGDWARLAERVSALAQDPALMQTIGQQNAAAAQSLYGIEAYQMQLQALFAQWQTLHPEWFAAKDQDLMSLITLPPAPIHDGGHSEKRKTAAGRISAPYSRIRWRRRMGSRGSRKASVKQRIRTKSNVRRTRRSSSTVNMQWEGRRRK